MVRRLTTSDAAALAALDAFCFSTPWSEGSFAEALAKENYAFFGFGADGTLCGYGGITVVLDEADVTNVAVHPDHRRRGLGRSLMTALIGEAKARGVTLLHLEVREGNAAARSLYESLGFVVDGRRKGYYRAPTEDAILMTLSL